MTNVLVTTSRMPFALDEIRKLGRAGHDVFATDTFSTAPGSHSKYVTEAIVTPSPRFQTAAFLDAIEEVIQSRRIRLVLPTFEEVFYLARQRGRFSRLAEVFAAPFETLAMLHNKARFLELAGGLGLAVPRGRTVEDKPGLVDAIQEIGQFFARPVYSRGGVQLYTNVGPLAGVVTLDDCEPTPQNPWIVQEFVRGLDVCSFSIVHHGDVAAHSVYVHPRMMEHAGGITFESVEEGGTLDATRRIVEATGYHGQISLDFMRTPRGLVLIECNPRATAGVYVMPAEMFEEAVFRPGRGRTRLAPAGTTRKVSIALVRDMLRDWREIPADLQALFSKAPDVYAEREDLLPALYQFLSFEHVLAYRHAHRASDEHKRTALMSAYFDDVLWDGEAIDAPTDSSSAISDHAASPPPPSRESPRPRWS